MGIDSLLLAVLSASDIAASLTEAGATKQQLEEAVRCNAWATCKYT
jgi:hypothetical protein